MIDRGFKWNTTINLREWQLERRIEGVEGEEQRIKEDPEIRKWNQSSSQEANCSRERGVITVKEKENWNLHVLFLVPLT